MNQLSIDMWLFKTIPYDTNYHIKDVLNEMFESIRSFVLHTPELKFDYEAHTLLQKWYSFVYQRQYLSKQCLSQQFSQPWEPYDFEFFQYFGSKFSDELQDLQSHWNSSIESYSLTPWISLKYPLHLDEFLFDVLLIQDPYVDSDEEELHENEENITYSIDESNVH